MWSRSASFRPTDRMISELSRAFRPNLSRARLTRSHYCVSIRDDWWRVAFAMFAHYLRNLPSRDISYGFIMQSSGNISLGWLVVISPCQRINTIVWQLKAPVGWRASLEPLYVFDLRVAAHGRTPLRAPCQLRTVRVGESCPDGPHLLYVPAFWALSTCTQFVRSRGQPF